MKEPKFAPYPKDLPKKFTGISSKYSLKVSLAILAILLFFVLFFSLVASACYLVYFSIIYPLEIINKFTILLKLGSIAGSAMVVVFLMKFVIKLRNHQPENRIEVSQESEPDLWNFIHQICFETGAPKPKRIYLDPDVNAYVRYTNNLLSLIMPVKKELTIGMSLIEAINVSEFKAIMSHEFGHFAQTSMRVGSYVGTANTIIHDLIYNRDKWDTTIQRWAKQDFRIAFVAWILIAIIFGIRKVLTVFYFLLNLLHSSLSREMEFNADKFAVSTTGSIPIISGLWKLDLASDKWNLTIKNAYNAKLKGIYTTNLFYHYEKLMVQVHEEKKKAYQELKDDERGGKLLFTTSEVSKAHMYDSHPANDQREKNAKSPFIDCEIDERSPWFLIKNKIQLQEKLTKHMYKLYWEISLDSTANTELMEEFITEEKREVEVMEKYYNTFENRYITIPTMDLFKEVLQKNNPLNEEDSVHLLNELKELMEPVWDLTKKMEHAGHIFNGTALVSSLTYNNVEYKKKNINKAYELIFQDRENLFLTKFTHWDHKLCFYIAQKAEKEQKLAATLKHFEFHSLIMNLLKQLNSSKNQLIKNLNVLQGMNEVNIHDINNYTTLVLDTIRVINEELAKITEENFVQLPNVENLETFQVLIHSEKEFKKIEPPMFENGTFDGFMYKLDVAIQQCNRLELKSLATLLS